MPEVLGNVSFPALSATPVWRRMINGKKVAIALPVEGKRQPLVYAGKQARPLPWLCLPACDAAAWRRPCPACDAAELPRP